MESEGVSKIIENVEQAAPKGALKRENSLFATDSRLFLKLKVLNET